MPGKSSALAVLRRAIQGEVAGHRFYTDAAFFCIDLRAKEVFAVLAQDEEQHTRLLLVQYESLAAEGRWLGPEAAEVASATVDITRFTFPEEECDHELFPTGRPASQAVDRRSSDLAALAFGLRLERRTIDLYRQTAADTQNEAARETFGFLVEEEEKHHRGLLARWEELAGIPYYLEEDEDRNPAAGKTPAPGVKR